MAFKVINGLRQSEKVDAIILLSHNGMDVDLKLATRVTGIITERGIVDANEDSILGLFPEQQAGSSLER